MAREGVALLHFNTAEAVPGDSTKSTSALAEDQDSVATTHMAPHSCLKLHFLGIQHLSQLATALNTCGAHK